MKTKSIDDPFMDWFDKRFLPRYISGGHCFNLVDEEFTQLYKMNKKNRKILEDYFKVYDHLLDCRRFLFVLEQSFLDTPKPAVALLYDIDLHNQSCENICAVIGTAITKVLCSGSTNIEPLQLEEDIKIEIDKIDNFISKHKRSSNRGEKG